ncbi:MAG TPA: dTMP kinase [Thermomicrobiales bacterium]|nr:dTMP kinase [Thermomicrobiales bacterium]
MFVTFEGTEGSGKSTQIALLDRTLRVSGRSVVTTREPGGTELGESLRRILLESGPHLDPATEAYLMTAARSAHVRQVIRPALARGDIVLCDRFHDSTFAYQGAGRGLELDALACLQELAVGLTTPHLTVLLDLPVEVGLQRRHRAGSGNRIDRESRDFHQRVAEWYRRASRNDVGRWRVVDATQPPDLVHTAVLKHVLARLDVEAATRHGSCDR